eukprot:2124314-Pyramimonas_sp.AAC.1
MADDTEANFEMDSRLASKHLVRSLVLGRLTGSSLCLAVCEDSSGGIIAGSVPHSSIVISSSCKL